MGSQEYSCEQDISADYYRASRLFEMLTIAHGDGGFGKLLTQLAKTDLLIILDRLLHNAHKIKLEGESMRKKQTNVDPR